MTRYIHIFKVKIILAPKNLIQAKLDTFLTNNKASHIVTANPEILLKSLRDKSYHEILQQADLITADGIGISWVAKFKTNDSSLSDRTTGVDLTDMVLQRSQADKLPVLIYLPTNSLSSPQDIKMAIEKNYPGAIYKIVVDQATSLQEINEFQPQIILNTQGAPYQEVWISQNMKKIPTLRIAIGVGGTFDFISGKIKRAPIWLRKIGMEWFWRLLHEPKERSKRLKRVIRAVVIFPLLAIFDK